MKNVFLISVIILLISCNKLTDSIEDQFYNNIKDDLYDPSSYEFVSMTPADVLIDSKGINQDTIYSTRITFRGKNKIGALVLSEKNCFYNSKKEVIATSNFSNEITINNGLYKSIEKIQFEKEREKINIEASENADIFD